jgi:hypothetical protein
VRGRDVLARDVLFRDLEMPDRELPDDEPLAMLWPEFDIGIAPDLARVERVAVREPDLDAGRDRVADRRVVAVARRVVDVARRAVDAGAGLALCMVLAAVMSAFAAVVIALVAVFIDCIADDIVRADAVALVAAAVILVAAEFTLVAADETPFAAVAGVVPARLDVLRRTVVVRLVPIRLAVPRRAAVEREAVVREAVDRDAVLRVDRDAVLRGFLVAVPRADFAALLRLADGLAEDIPEPDMDFDRLAVPRDALRLTGLLRAELAELRRVAARVVDCTGTENSPRLDQLRGVLFHTRRVFTHTTPRSVRTMTSSGPKSAASRTRGRHPARVSTRAGAPCRSGTGATPARRRTTPPRRSSRRRDASGTSPLAGRAAAGKPAF